jgi:hypothetical protein
MRGPTVATVPPITDRNGNIYVVTGAIDTAGTAQPGQIYVGGTRGGWTSACATGFGPDGVGAGWIGAVDDKAWLWTHAAIIQIDTTGKCTTILDRDPVSMADLRYESVAPVIEQTISAVRAVAIVTLASDARRYLVTIDLTVPRITSSMPVPDGVGVLGGGGGGGTGAFLLDDGQLLLATPGDGLTAQYPVTGATAVHGEIGVGDDGSIAAVLADGSTLVGSGPQVQVVPATIPASGTIRDDDGNLWLTAVGPKLVPVRGGNLGAPVDWTSAAAADAAIQAGVMVVDERAGGRTGSTWLARNVLEDATLVGSLGALPYAVGVRGWLIGDAPVDRGGQSFSNVAFVPLGVTFP